MGQRARFLLIALVSIWLRYGTPVMAFPNDCGEVCTNETSCHDSCYPDELAFINGNSITCLQWGTYATPCCGDNSCTAGENASNCFDDCHCGNGTCDGGENQSTCSQDCTGGGGGGGGGGGVGSCGDGVCNGQEGCDTCPQDCHDTAHCGFCGDQQCGGNEIGGAGSGNENKCNPITSPWCVYCPNDCGGCQGFTCDPSHGSGWGSPVCEDQYGKCRACFDSADCPYGDEVCNPLSGLCVAPRDCQPHDDNYCVGLYGTGWTCGNDNTCKPPF